MIRTAIVGFGFSSRTFHIPFLIAEPAFEWTHIVSTRPEAVHLDHPDIIVVPNIDQLDPNSVDLVIVTSPNDQHFLQVKALLEAGFHVLVEKPFVLSQSEAEVLRDISERVGKRLVVFQNRRWDGDFLTLRSLIESKRVGKVHRFTSRFDRFRPVVRDRWREQPGYGVGILWDLAPHLIDQVIALFGAPDYISANLNALRDGSDITDCFEIWLDYPGLQVTLGSSCFQAGPNCRFMLEGNEGTFTKYGLDVQEDALKLGLNLEDDQWGMESEESWGVLYRSDKSQILTTNPGNYSAFWQQLSLHILGQSASPVPIEESILGIQLIEMAIKANELGQKLRVD